MKHALSPKSVPPRQRCRAANLSIVGLYISPGHNFFGRHGRHPGRNPALQVSEIRCLAGRGIVGDRFLDHAQDYRGQITFFSVEVYEDLCRTLDIWDRDPGVFRRNVIVAGAEPKQYIGREFDLQGVLFQGVSECSPCHWMNRAFGPGGEEQLKGRGGLRARILSDGMLRLGDA